MTHRSAECAFEGGDEVVGQGADVADALQCALAQECDDAVGEAPADEGQGRDGGGGSGGLGGHGGGEQAQARGLRLAQRGVFRVELGGAERQVGEGPPRRVLLVARISVRRRR